MNRQFIKAAALYGALCCGAALIGRMGPAPRAAAEQEPVATFTFEMVATPVPEPTLLPVERKSTEAEAEKLARLLWSSPLRAETYKRQLVRVVLNRVDDRTGRFADSIDGVITRQEFTFYDRHAHVSAENMRIVCEELEAWRSGRNPMPGEYVFIRFVGDGNRCLEVMKEVGGPAL